MNSLLKSLSWRSHRDNPRAAVKPGAELLPTGLAGSHPEAHGATPVIIGLDFGTHSTKVTFRARTANESALTGVGYFDEPLPGYPEFGTPSQLRHADGRLWFGAQAVRHNGGDVYGRLKLDLLDYDPARLARRDRMHPELAAACFLAWTLSACKPVVRKRIENFRGFVNLAAPMDHFENGVLKQRYLRVANAAWLAVFGPGPCEFIQGMDASDILSGLAELLQSELPEADSRRYDVLPETMAPIVSLAQESSTKPGNYLLVDMGAGTTEMSMNQLDTRAGGPIRCYFDQTIRLGTHELSSVDGENVCHLRRLAEEVEATWRKGYRKDGNNQAARESWKGPLTILLAGGGTLRDDVRRAIDDNRMRIPYAFQGTEVSLRRHNPSAIDVPSGDRSLLQVAHGLAFPHQQWPIRHCPAEIGELPEPRVKARDANPFGYADR